ncbi:MAG: PTS sugar transporter subunit IIB [Elusimicrobiota bacterium]|jgi:PTS system mannose-specific IIB component|nr:PTS sugar transporter subunit IIB [Elusimicrobiota bacterium]
MPIVTARVDDRLIHGQIVQGWLKNIDVDAVLVVSDAAVQDAMQQVLMSLAMPSNIRLDVKNSKDAVESILNGTYSRERLFIVSEKPEYILQMIENGVDLKSINVGGMHFANGKRKILFNLFADDNDVEVLYKIYLKGIEIEGRILPKDERVNVISVVEREYHIIFGES